MSNERCEGFEKWDGDLKVWKNEKIPKNEKVSKNEIVH